ncbi:MAG: ATP-binding cassette domain-containing protein, partial [Paracoccaceae bacterium]|nr:ATP-binding cassette domain-containing protein [Paracoccaceae bacterium]
AIKGVTKGCGAVQVLNGVDLTIEAGTVVGLVGDNGAGKSTLMKTVTGIYGVDAGEISLNGARINEVTPGARREMGIEMIYQDLALAKQQDVAANIFLGREPVKRPFGFLPGYVDKAKMDREALRMIDRLGARIPSIHRPVGMFSGGQQQTIAIARALTFNPKLVIMDEPTAALAVREVESVLKLIRQMRDEGIAVILISHRLNDVFEVTDRIVVLRQGRIEADLATKDTQMHQVVSYIVGAH